MSDIDGLHHVGHLVRDLGTAADRLTRLGFRVDPPSFPALSPTPGEEPRAFGAGNAHVTFTHNFVEIATVVGDDGQVPPNAELVPLEVAEEARPALLAAIESTVHNLAACLARFEGLHILMLASSDIDGTAERLTTAGIPHGGVHVTRRPARPGEPDSAALLRYLEIGDPTLGPGRVPEGRVGAAVRIQPEQANGRARPAHPNGAVDLVGCVLCVPPDQLGQWEQRYASYLDHPARMGAAGRIFDIGEGTITLVTPRDLTDLFPGEEPPDVPAMVGYQVAVPDISETASFLQKQGIEPSRTPSGELLVSSMYAGGTAIAFRELPPNGPDMSNAS